MEFLAAFKKFSANFFLLLFSVFITLLLGEMACRIVLNPVDYLSPDRVKDTILGSKIKQKSGGHDAWGFRNKSVPDSSDVVVIGDSQTYGYNATMESSYPAQLQKILKKNVYNMSQGGYGPVQYNYLLKNNALKLKPSIIIIGLYFGNDIMDSYNTAYNHSYWKNLRSSSFENSDTLKVSGEVEIKIKKKNKLSQRMRHWLAGNSIIYQLITKVAFKSLGTLQLDDATDKEDYVKFENKPLKIQKYFTPKTRFTALNIDDLRVQEGLRISINLIKEMNQTSRSAHIQFIVLMIPTAETVYSDFFNNSMEPAGYSMLKKLLNSEQKINKIIKDSLNISGIEYIDMTDSLKLKSKIVPGLYLPGPDGHPSSVGYGVIADAIYNSGLINRKK